MERFALNSHLILCNDFYVSSTISVEGFSAIEISWPDHLINSSQKRLTEVMPRHEANGWKNEPDEKTGAACIT